MSRILLTLLGAVLTGALSWSIVGATAAWYFTRTGGSREGANAMGGFFFVGGLAGLAGLIGGGWLLWNLAANPARHAFLGWSLAGAAAVLIGGWVVAMQPVHDPGIAWPKGMRGEAQVEVRMPAARVGDAKPGMFRFDFRCGGYTLEARPNPAQFRSEAGWTVIPGAFTLRDRQQTFLFAVMRGEEQLGTHSIELTDESLTTTTEWSEWGAMEGGMEVRYRTAVVAK